MRSSYALHDYAKVFHSIVTALLPVTCVELGVLDGYSAIAMGRALKENAERRGTRGALHAYDLFEDYPFTHGQLQSCADAVRNAGVQEFVTLEKADAWTVHERYPDRSVSLLHVDLSNTGETLARILELWDKKLVQGGVLCFEGGSDERDQVEWMTRYQKPSIKTAMETNPIIAKNYVFGTYLHYPSLTTLLKKRCE